MLKLKTIVYATFKFEIIEYNSYIFLFKITLGQTLNGLF